MRAAHEWSVWSTRARVCVTEVGALDEAVARVRMLLGEVDEVASRFRDDSEVGRLVTGTQRVSPLLADLVRVALDAAADTDGAVDPTVGAALVDLGYDRTLPDLAPADLTGRPVAPPGSARPAPGWRSVRLDDDLLTLPAGCRLDLGATAKAATSDRAAALVADRLGCGVLVSLGGDVATAGPTPPGGWRVRVSDHVDDPDAHVTLSDGWALATSSTLRRRWQRGGRTWHHVLDPATGRSATTPWRTVSVAAPTCAEANALSTAVVVKGDDGLAWVRDRALPARLVDEDHRVHRVGGWPAEPTTWRVA